MNKFIGFIAVAAVAALTATLYPHAAAQSSIEQRTSPLPPGEVFLVSAIRNNDTASIVYQMPPGFYLYRERFQVAVAGGDVKLDAVTYPPAKTYDDPFFGVTEIYRDSVTLTAKTSGGGNYDLRIISQGCDEQLGICYPPQIHTAKLDGNGRGVVSHISAVDAGGINEGGSGIGDDEAADVVRVLSDSSLWQILITFFGFGLLLSFTPCVLPMLPVLLGIISGAPGKKPAARLTLAYIAGVCAAYTGLGVAAGLSGQLFLPYLQSPPALIVTALLFIVLSLSMFGMFEIQLPAGLRGIGSRGRGGSIGGAAAMGAVSAAVVSPCVAAPLVGALIYIGKSGDAVLGGLALLSLSLGMSALLAAAGIGGVALPRAGAWMIKIRQLSGILLLAVAVWVTSTLLPGAVVVFLYGALAAAGGLLLFGVGVEGISKKPIMRAAGVVLMLWGGVMLIGAAGGARDPLSPLSVFREDGGGTEAPPFTDVASAGEIKQLVRTGNRPAMLEFYADWCVSCKEMERFTFTDAEVQAQLSSLTLLRADVTENDRADRALMQAFDVYGPPAIIFFAANGDVIANVRVNGYQSAERFLRTLAAANIATAKTNTLAAGSGVQ